MRIQLHEHDVAWADTFRTHRNAIAAALGPKALRIEHIGSTSVPGLAAKPIIDILLVVADSADEDAYVPEMIHAGYELRVREPDFHEHRMFKTPTLDVQIHTFSPDSPEVDRCPTFRNRLRTHESDRLFYEQTKRTLAAQDWDTVDDYARAKSDAVERIIANARREQAADVAR